MEEVKAMYGALPSQSTIKMDKVSYMKFDDDYYAKNKSQSTIKMDKVSYYNNESLEKVTFSVAIHNKNGQGFLLKWINVAILNEASRNPQ